MRCQNSLSSAFVTSAISIFLEPVRLHPSARSTIAAAAAEMYR
jgi:hypothetical protein